MLTHTQSILRRPASTVYCNGRPVPNCNATRAIDVHSSWTIINIRKSIHLIHYTTLHYIRDLHQPFHFTSSATPLHFKENIIMMVAFSTRASASFRPSIRDAFNTTLTPSAPRQVRRCNNSTELEKKETKNTIGG